MCYEQRESTKKVDQLEHLAGGNLARNVWTKVKGEKGHWELMTGD